MATRFAIAATLIATLCFVAEGPAFAQDDPDVYISAGPASELLLGAGGMNFTSAFTTKGGFKPEEIAYAGDGKLYICDASNSEIFRFDPSTDQLTTIYDRDSAISPNDPEQPKGCAVAGNDLLFLSRNGRGNGAKTGLWAIQNVTSSPGAPVLLLGLDAVGGVSGQGLAVNFDGRVFFTFGNDVWVATPQPGAGRIDGNSDFHVWGHTAAEGFGIASKSVLASSGSLQTQVFVAAKYAGVIEVLQEVGGAGTSSGCSVINVATMPNALEFDGAGDLWVAASEQSSGRRGSVYEVDNPACSPSMATATLVADGLSAAVGIALTPSASAPITLTSADFVDGKSGNANLCNSLFNLDQVTAACQDTWTISCRLMSQDEFSARTPMFPSPPDGDFSATTCAQFPGASGNCTEIRISQVAPSACTVDDVLAILANWQFYSLSSLIHPGMLYSPGAFGSGGPEDNPFTENILVNYDPTPSPTDPIDPGATGSRDGWGSGIAIVDNAPNRAPTAVLTAEPEVAQCNEPVTLDGLASFDNDWNVDHRDSITRYVFTLDGGPLQDGPTGSYVVDTSTIATGAHTASLQVFDEGWDSQGILASAIVEAEFTSARDTGPPVFTAPVTLVDLAQPQVTISVDGESATMWPPNHEMIPFELVVQVEDECEFSCEIIATSNEPDNGTGDGDIAPDVQVTGDTTLNLRAERAQNGTGRTYTITVKCTDEVGNVTVSDPITVFVPSSQSGD